MQRLKEFFLDIVDIWNLDDANKVSLVPAYETLCAHTAAGLQRYLLRTLSRHLISSLRTGLPRFLKASKFPTG